MSENDVIYSEKYDNPMFLTSSPQIKIDDKWHGGDLTLTNSTLAFKTEDGKNISLNIKNIIRIFLGPMAVTEIIIVYTANNEKVKSVTYYLRENSKKLVEEIKKLDYQTFGANDSKEIKKVQKIKENSLYFFSNDAGDYLAIFKDHMKMKAYNDSKDWKGPYSPYNYPLEYKYISFEERISYDGLMISFSKTGGTTGCPHIHFGQHGQWNTSQIIYFRNGKDWKNVKNLIEKTKTEYGKINISQKVVHGDEVTKTEIKDSVVSKSNIGSGGDDKFSRLEKLTDMKKEGLIDDDEFKQMKKEILGK